MEQESLNLRSKLKSDIRILVKQLGHILQIAQKLHMDINVQLYIISMLDRSENIFADIERTTFDVFLTHAIDDLRKEFSDLCVALNIEMPQQFGSEVSNNGESRDISSYVRDDQPLYDSEFSRNFVQQGNELIELLSKEPNDINALKTTLEKLKATMQGRYDVEI